MSFGYKSMEPYPQEPPSDGDPEIVYLNLDIINNNRNDGTALDPFVRFNETRDAPIIKDASKYQFSIIRLQLVGSDLDLPLFIPVVKTNQADPNVTEYEVAISYQQTWATTEDPGGITITATPVVNSVVYDSETQNPIFAPTPLPPNGPKGQDISTRYYWVYTFQHWVDLVNAALLTAHQNTFAEFQAQWALVTADAFPYVDYDAWVAAVGVAPWMEYDPASKCFSIYADTRSFGETTPTFTPTPTELTAPRLRLFFDSNMFGLFPNFDNTFYGGPSSGAQGPFYPLPTPTGYINEILFPNKQYQNILDLKTTPAAYVPAVKQQYYWITTQEYIGTSSLWSPIGALVFTSTLLPVRAEGTGAPVVFGDNNLGYGSASIQNAFQPIVTDISLDTSARGPEDYRTSIYYAPTAEYRMASLSSSKQPVYSVDIQLYWKNRLDGTLNPVSIPNLGSVSLKAMFRRIRN